MFGLKNSEGVFPSLPARNERGESWREGKLTKNGPLSPALSSFFGEEREKGSAAALQTTCQTVLVCDSRCSKIGSLHSCLRRLGRAKITLASSRLNALSVRQWLTAEPICPASFINP